MAHLHLGLLAYWVVNTIRHQLKQKGINNEWRDIVRIMNTQKLVTTTMTNNRYQQIVIRQCSEPTEKVSQIYKALNYKQVPFTRTKYVVPTAEQKNSKPLIIQYLYPGKLQCGLRHFALLLLSPFAKPALSDSRRVTPLYIQGSILPRYKADNSTRVIARHEATSRDECGTYKPLIARNSLSVFTTIYYIK